MHRRTSVFDNPITERRFLKHLEEKEKRDFENFKRKEEIIFDDNLSERIINAIFEKP